MVLLESSPLSLQAAFPSALKTSVCELRFKTHYLSDTLLNLTLPATDARNDKANTGAEIIINRLSQIGDRVVVSGGCSGETVWAGHEILSITLATLQEPDG